MSCDIEVEGENLATVTGQGAVEIELVSSAEPCVQDSKDLSVEVNRKEYNIVGDELYIPKLYDDAPEWLQNLIDQTVSTSLEVERNSLNEATESLNTLIEELEVAKNTYTQSIISSNDIDQRINTAITTLNSQLADADATILEIAQTAVTPEEARAITIDGISAQLENTDNGSLGATIGDLDQARATGDSANATSIETLSTSLEGEVDARADAVSGLDARIDVTEAGVTANAEAITSLSTELNDGGNTWAAGDTAIRSTLEADISNNKAQVESAFEYTSRLDIDESDISNPYITGFSLVSRIDSDGSPVVGSSSEFNIRADKFSLVDPDSGNIVNMDEDGLQFQRYYNGNYITHKYLQSIRTFSNHDNNVSITLLDVLAEPKILISPSSMPVYIADKKDQDQSFLYDVTNKSTAIYDYTQGVSTVVPSIKINDLVRRYHSNGSYLTTFRSNRDQSNVNLASTNYLGTFNPASYPSSEFVKPVNFDGSTYYNWSEFVEQYPSEGVFSFTPKAELKLSSGVINENITGETADSSVSVLYSGSYAATTSLNSITMNYEVKSTRSTSTQGIYYYRKATVQLQLNNVDIGVAKVHEFGASTNSITSSITDNTSVVPGDTVRIKITYEDVGGTFTAGTTGYWDYKTASKHYDLTYYHNTSASFSISVGGYFNRRSSLDTGSYWNVQRDGTSEKAKYYNSPKSAQDAVNAVYSGYTALEYDVVASGAVSPYSDLSLFAMSAGHIATTVPFKTTQVSNRRDTSTDWVVGEHQIGFGGTKGYYTVRMEFTVYCKKWIEYAAVAETKNTIGQLSLEATATSGITLASGTLNIIAIE